MINKGVIMEISKRYIIILNEDGDYLKLKPKKGTYISQKIFYTQNDLYKKKTSYTKLSSIAAIFIMCFFVASFFYLNNPVNSYGQEWIVVSVDINPSIEFSLNDEYIVRNVIPLNDEAKQLISDEWLGKDFDFVMTSYLDVAVETRYLNEEGTVLLAYYVKDKNIDDKDIEEKFEEIINNSNAKNPNVAFIKSNKEDLKQSRKENISLGRYKIYDEISEKSGQTMEQIKKGKVKNLIKKADNVKMIKIKNRKNQDEDSKNKDIDNKNNNHKKNNNNIIDDTKEKNNGNSKNQDNNQNNKQNINNDKPDKINPGKGLGPKSRENSEEINENDEKNNNDNNNRNKNDNSKIKDENQNNKPNENNGKPDSGEVIDPKPQGNTEEININNEENNLAEEESISEEKEEPISKEKEESTSEDNSQDNENNQKPTNNDESTQNKDKPQSQKDSDKEGNTNSKGNNSNKKDKGGGS